MGDIHQVFSVTATVDGALAIDADFTGVSSGVRMRAVYILRDGDEYGSAPMFRQWVEDNNPQVLPYEPPPEPTPEEIRAAMPPLAKWRVDTVIDLEPGLRDKINAAIEAMPEPNRTISKNKLASVTEFIRTDPLFELIGGDPSIGKSPEDIDAMWQAALALQ
jgi:hypothetical protein